MKKTISVVLCLILILSLVGCGNKTKTQGEIVENTTKQEVGTWALKDIEFGEELMQEMWGDTEISEEDAQLAKEFYLSLLAGYYFEFYEDGTGITGYYIPQEYMDLAENADDTTTPIRWASGKLLVDENEAEATYVIDNAELKVDNEGTIMTFEKINSLEEIENSSLFQLLEELGNAFTDAAEEAVDDVGIDD